MECVARNDHVIVKRGEEEEEEYDGTHYSRKVVVKSGQMMNATRNYTLLSLRFDGDGLGDAVTGYT